MSGGALVASKVVMETRQESNCHQIPTGKGRRAVTLEQTLDRQKELGHYLADHRNAMNLSLEQIAQTTKIPKSSLHHLEAGQFDKLPGDVFVRGFLRSYARCVHLDGDDVVRRYAQCGLKPAPVSSELADSLLAGKRRSFAAGTQAPPAAAPSEEIVDAVVAQAKGEAVRKVLRDAFDLSKQRIAKVVAAAPSEEQVEEPVATKASEAKAPAHEKAKHHVAPEERVRTFIPPSFQFDDEMSRRGPLTLGVIILVIVATLTMSYLLRRPGTSTDGFTMLDEQAPRMGDVLMGAVHESASIDLPDLSA